jgi:hypothetical protein
MTTILLGPQRFMTTAGTALQSLDVDGPVATITAGWEEREEQDAELDQILFGRTVNLRLYHRMFDVLDKDEAFRAAVLGLRDRLDELHSFYSLRVEAAMAGVYAVLRHSSPFGMREPALEAAIESVRAVDDWYITAMIDARRAFRDEPIMQNSVMAWHRAELAATVAECVAVVIPGGHVGTLLRAIQLFELRIPDELPVIAWSAGAMALTSRVVLFHDFAAHGASEAELYDRGLGRVPGVIALPHARRRLRLDDRERCSVLVRRFASYHCLLLDDGTSVQFDETTDGLPTGARFLNSDGVVTQVGAE